jgi:hypothetical protein
MVSRNNSDGWMFIQYVTLFQVVCVLVSNVGGGGGVDDGILSIVRRREDGEDETEVRGFNVFFLTFLLYVLGVIMINL